MKKKLFFLFLFLFLPLFVFVKTIHSDELDDINKKINDLTTQLSVSVNATRPLESQLINLQFQISDIKARIAFIESDVAVKKKNIDIGFQNLQKQEVVLHNAIRDYYIKSYADSPFLIFLSARSATQVTQALAYQKVATDQDKIIITSIAQSIADLQVKKKNLEDEQVRLTAFKSTLDDQSKKLDTIVQGAKAFQSQLSSQIAQLSARQQQLLVAKLASLNLPTSAYTTQGGCVDDRNVNPGFSPRLAFYTYGVPNRVGLNQYGAKGRADGGQNAEQILSAYYNASLNKGYNTGITIHVVGTNEYGQSIDANWNIEDYVKHIYEMPTNWNPEALKAQAVAARSYALAVTNNGSSTICPSQSCQVVKTEINDGAWQAAVDATRGWVLTSGSVPIKAWFSSTHGGYAFSSSDIGWQSTPWTKNMQDTTGSVNSFSDLKSNAYDKASPWFYCDWGSRAAYNKTAWLKVDEVADIVNVILLAHKDGGTQNHLSQLDKPNPDGTDTWDPGKVKQELSNRGVSAYNTVSDVSVDWDKNGGKSTTVTVTGDAGTQSFSAADFKTYFNLRAPANINIVGPLFSVEKG